MTFSRRALLIGVPVVGALAVSGCSLFGGKLRKRLESELARVGYSHDGWLSASSTEVTVVETPLLTSWQVLHAVSSSGDQELIAAVPLEGEGVHVLTNEPSNWAEVLRSDGARIDVPASAAESARMLILTTDDQQGRQTMIESVDDMPWEDRDSTDVIAVRNEFGHDIAAPVAERDGDRWIATVWTTHQRDLIRHSVGIEPDLLHAIVDEVWVGDLPLLVES